MGLRVGLLDLDIYGPSLPIILGLNEQPKMTQDNKLIPLEKFGVKLFSPEVSPLLALYSTTV